MISGMSVRRQIYSNL